MKNFMDVQSLLERHGSLSLHLTHIGAEADVWRSVAEQQLSPLTSTAASLTSFSQVLYNVNHIHQKLQILYDHFHLC